MMNLEELRTYLKGEEQRAFSGWDFSYLDGRWETDEPKWDYKDILQTYLKKADNLLDIGTGGGEFLLSLNHPYELTSVTESYPPNVQLCKETLSPLGISVKQICDESQIPFDSNAFNIVINRQASFDAGEVNRILKADGYFITQQVGGLNNKDLSCKLIENYRPKFLNHNLNQNCDQLKNAGLIIILVNFLY